MARTARRFGRYSVDITNPDRVLFAESGLTKLDVIDYYDAVAEVMLRHIDDRPVSMQRFPNGIGAEGFFQKDIPDYFPNWITRAVVPKEGGKVTHVVCDNRATLVYLANQACITPHVWLSRTRNIAHPDRMIFDLDPSGVDVAPVCQAAHTLRELLEGMGLRPFVMTTGSRGLHVTVPLSGDADFDQVRDFARDVAELMAKREPKALTTEIRKNKRRGRVFLDVLRNGYAQTAVPPYAVRARPGAPVATPLEWDETSGDRDLPQRWTIQNIRKRLDAKGDPWKSIDRFARSLKGPRKKLDAAIART